MEMVEGVQSGLKKHDDVTQDALQNGGKNTHKLVKNFTTVLSLTAEYDKTVFEDVGDCFPLAYITSDVAADKVTEVIERLARSELCSAAEDVSLDLQNCEQEVNFPKSLIAQVDPSFSVAQEVAAEVDRTVDGAEKQSKEFQQIAVQTTVYELKRRWDALSMLCLDFHTLTLELESLKGRDGKVVRTISELPDVVYSYPVTASKAEVACERIAPVVNKAAVFRPDAAHEAKTPLKSYFRCITASESARKESSKALVGVHSTE
ncbi:hypothetical protein ERJ75_001214400 [Trypanosoma vivax]|nr:hypothetical protein ERJ75_001214400 [Trypanosoma vivax]